MHGQKDSDLRTLHMNGCLVYTTDYIVVIKHSFSLLFLP